MPNAVVVCRLCGTKVDKGVPADPTQDDASFVCAGCGSGGYPQNGWVSPAAVKARAEGTTARPSLLKRVFGKKKV